MSIKKTLKNSNAGQTIIAIAIFFSAVSVTILFIIALPITKQLEKVRNFNSSQQSLFLARSANEEMFYRLKNALPVGSTVTLTLNDISATASATDVSGGKEITAIGNVNNLLRNIKAFISIGEGVSFNYGVQAGEGGFTLANSSSIVGNVYSNGPVTGSGNTIDGGIVSAGPNGIVDNVYGKDSVYAHTIKNSTVSGNAYYDTIISNTSVAGIKYPNSSDQEIAPMPWSDSEIAGWETAAEAGGIIDGPCPYNISSLTLTMGQKRINCDVEISGTSIVTLTGPLWITGNLSIVNSSQIKIDPSIGDYGIAIIADNSDPGLKGTKGKISLNNTVQFFGSGFSDSYVLLISGNNSAEANGSNIAIDVANSVEGDLLLYAPHGEIQLANTVSLKEITAYEIHLKNSARVTYEEGLADALFHSGPGGAYNISWIKEIQ